MPEPLAISEESLQRCLVFHYGIEAQSIRRVTGGLDPCASSYQAATTDGGEWFVKLRLGGVRRASLEVPRYLTGHGVPNLLPPIAASSGQAWCDWEGLTVMVFPFVRAVDAASGGLSDAQWVELGRTLAAVHSAEVPNELLEGVRREEFDLPSREGLCEALEAARRASFGSDAAVRLADHLVQEAPQIEALLSRADDLRRQVLSKDLPSVVCHADVHPWNLLVSEQEKIYVIDWEDGPILAPRERDLIFFVRTDLWKPTEEREEALLLEGYGGLGIDRTAVTYFQLERVIEDLAVDAKLVFFSDDDFSEEKRLEAAGRAISYRLPGAPELG